MTRRCWVWVCRTVSVFAVAGGALPGCASDAARGSTASTAVRPAVRVTPSPHASTCGLADFQAVALARINRVRASGANCRSEGRFAPAPPVSWNDTLAQVAAQHSRDMAANNFFSHEGRDGRHHSQRIDAAGYAWKSIAENIEAGSGTVPEAIERWMASDHHCANLMAPVFTEVGVACVRGATSNTYETYWTLELGRPRK